MSELKAAILNHASEFDLQLDDRFIQSIITGVKSMGVLNPKIPDAFCQGGLKTLSPKVPPSEKLHGMSAFSVSMRQKYDWAGGTAGHMRAFRFLVTPFAVGEKWHAVADLTAAVNTEMTGLLGDDWGMCAAAIKEHLNRPDQYPMLQRCEKQIFWPVDVIEDKYLIISPMADMLPVELAHRLRERAALEPAQRFHRINYSVSSDKFQNSGVAACSLAGNFPKLMSLPPEGFREITPLPVAEPGRYLALEFDVVSMNATGASIVAGVTSITATVGFQEAFRREMLKNGVDLAMQGIAQGFSNVHFHGEQRDGRWTYFVKKSSRVTNDDKKTVLQMVAEMTANARVHLVIELKDSILPDFLPAVKKSLSSMRFAGGSIFNPQMTLAADAKSVMDAWGSNVYFIADRQADIALEKDKFNAALDRLCMTKNDNEQWKLSAPMYCLSVTGYQGIEPPRPRNGVRDPSCRHIFAASIVTLAQWVPATAAAADQVFWKAGWNRVTYAARAEADFCGQDSC